MRFTELVRGATLQGDASTWTAAACVKLGRGLGTLTRRRMAAGRARVVVARSKSLAEGKNTAPVRDGIVRGLLLSGHDVKDIGALPNDVFLFALKHLEAGAGVFIDDGLSIMFFVVGRPLASEGLQALAELADGDDFSAGEGSLDFVDVRAAFRARPAQGERP